MDSGRERAEDAFRRAIAIDAHYWLAHRDLGWILSQAKGYAAAERCLREAIRLAPEDAMAHAYLGIVLAFVEQQTMPITPRARKLQVSQPRTMDSLGPKVAIRGFQIPTDQDTVGLIRRMTSGCPRDGRPAMLMEVHIGTCKRREATIESYALQETAVNDKYANDRR